MKEIKEKSVIDLKFTTPEVEIQDDQLKAIKGGFIILSDTDIQ